MDDVAAARAPSTAQVDVVVDGRALQIEVEDIVPAGVAATAPRLVFLHEGLGSVSLWRDWPARLCAAAGMRGLVWSRPGYGRSTPRAPDERWPVTFMHHQAQAVLPALLERLEVDPVAQPPWLFGHSDGGSIALIHAASFPARVAGVVAVAPHLFVEAVSVASIAKTRTAYLDTDLRARLARHHADVDSAFFGWNDIWLDPAFASWNIEALLPAITCPVLAVQGVDDEYGTMAQIDAIPRLVPGARTVALERCGHSPHRDQPDALERAVVAFLAAHRADAA